jgi:hypothetical protein
MTTSQFPIAAPVPPPNALDKTPGANPMAPESASAAIPAPKKQSLVKMQNPSGGIGDVPEERVSAATEAGYQPVVQMTNPAGNAGYVPTHKAGDALKAGYKYGAPIKDNSTIQAAPSTTQRIGRAISDVVTGLGNPLSVPATIARGGQDPLTAAKEVVNAPTESIESMTQQGKAQHPLLAKLAEVSRGIKDLTEGEQSGRSGKSLGTSSGPLEAAAMLAPVGEMAESGAAAEEAVTGLLERRAAAKAAAEAAESTPTVAEVTPEHFTYREPTPAPQHGEPFKTPAPLDNPTIVKSLGGKDLSPEAINTLKQHVGGTPGAEIEVGSTPKNTVMKAVEPMQKTLAETGIKMNKVIQNAPAFKSSVLADTNSTLLQDIADLRDNLPLKADDPLNKVFDKQVEAAYDVLNSTDPKEVLAYRRKLGSQIDWSDIRQSPETTKDAKDLVQAKIYRALGEKLHTEIPETAQLDKVFQPNLELQ